jgi:uncharacterized surface protein with fasciclin (FAS1) repeats
MTQFFRPALVLRPALAALALIAAPVASAEPPVFMDIAQTPHTQGDVLETAAATGQFRTFLRLVSAAGYEDTLRAPGPVTVFAPTDEAFSHMSRVELERLSAPAAHQELLRLLRYHTVRGRVTTASQHGQISNVNAASGYRLVLDGRNGLRVNDQLVVLPDLDAKNGVVQGVNSILQPPVMVASN